MLKRLVRCNALAALTLLVLAAPAAAQVTPLFQRIKWIQTDDGTAGAPAYSFTLNPKTGRYRIGLDNLGEAVNGTLKFDWNATRLKLASGYQFTVGANNLLSSDLLDPTKFSTLVPGASGGTNNGFFQVIGPATSLKTFTFPNASATMLTDNAAVTPAQGGTGLNNTATSGRYLKGNGTNFATSSGSASGTGACSGSNWVNTLNSDAAPTCSQPASTDLSDQASGTWTPSVGGTATYTVQAGQYAKTGHRVDIQAYLGINAIGTGNTGQISGLPYSSSVNYPACAVGFFSGAANSFTHVAAYVSGSNINITGQTAAGTSDLNPPVFFASGTSVVVSCSYYN
jgi:hypothetical protein